MEKTNKAVYDINNIFETICIIYDENELCFDPAKVLLEKLNNALILIKTLDTKYLTNDIWDEVSNSNQLVDIHKMVNRKFHQLKSWKANSPNIISLNIELKKDLTLFYEKQVQINKNYTISERTEIGRYYFEISQRLFKFRLDLQKEVSLRIRMIEDEISFIKQTDYTLNPELPCFQIHPDKKHIFATAISNMFDEDYFSANDTSQVLSKKEVLTIFSILFNAGLDVDNYVSSDNNTVELPEGTYTGKNFPDFLVHEKPQKLAEEIKKTFTGYKGKQLSLLLHAMKTFNPPLITVVIGQNNELHRAMKAYFKGDIGTYQSIFNNKNYPELNSEDINSINTHLTHILDKL